jgi:hypothetical protein
MLTVSTAAFAFVAAYLWVQGRSRSARPEDRAEAEPSDATGEVGYFPTSSIWPFVLASGAVLVANALVFGVWLAIFGGLVFFTGVVGYALEAQGKA